MRKNFTLCFLVAGLLTYDTVTAADFTVTSTADSGPGTLRQALVDAAASPGTDNILFNIPASPGMIMLNSSLTISTPVVIDGYSQPGATQGPVNSRQLAVSLNFNAYNAGVPANDGLIITTGNVTVRGVAIFRAIRGVVINGTAGTGGAVKIQGCTIGLNESNQSAIEDPNTGDFLPSRNSSHGIFFATTSSGFVIPRVFIGVDGDGTNDANEGNHITNSQNGDGIFLNNADYNVIAGNFIGTTATGSSPVFTGTNNNGITFDGTNVGDGCSNNRIGTNGDGVSDALEGNLISANRRNGIVLQRRGNFNTIAGNSIGLTLGGGPAGNGRTNAVPAFTPTFLTEGNGILLNNVSNNIIGVTPGTGVPAQRNFIASSFYNGITLYSSAGGSNGFVTNNSVMGNTIGANQAGLDRGNLNWGVFVANAPTGSLVFNNFVGSDDDGTNDNVEGNVIAYNQRDGVGVFEQITDFVFDIRISRNSTFGNNRPGAGTQGYGLGINLMTALTDGSTPNTPVGSGPNFLYNYPVTLSFGVNTTEQKIEVTGTAPSGGHVQYYLASADANQDAPTFNEGQTFLFGADEGGLLDEDLADGAFKFTIPFSALAASVAPGNSVVALAHSAAAGPASTSEFNQTFVSTVLLPVQFVSFKAELQNEKVLVSWSTAQEQNASHFDVERSTNGRDFAKIGSVKAKGNSNSLTNYSFLDNSPALGVSYYRLRQVDIDNRFVYTKTVIIRNEARSKAFSVWPNPVLDNVNVTLQSDKNQNLNLRVVDFNGRVVSSQVVNANRGINQITVNMASLSKGMYMIQLLGDNLNLSQKVIKQ